LPEGHSELAWVSEADKDIHGLIHEEEFDV
jgi:hypothetical protein